MPRGVLAALAMMVATSGCESESPPPKVAAPPRIEDLPAFGAPELVRGRAVWIERCSPCHLNGVVGAPRILDKEAWAPRIAKGMDVLVRHATEGFESAAGTQMPARGGHADLGDAEVASAVAFVVAASR